MFDDDLDEKWYSFAISYVVFRSGGGFTHKIERFPGRTSDESLDLARGELSVRHPGATINLQVDTIGIPLIRHEEKDADEVPVIKPFRGFSGV